MPINFTQVGAFNNVIGSPGAIIPNPTSIQFGPDGRLYVTEQTGDVNAFTLGFNDGEVVAIDHELLTIGSSNLGVVESIANHNDTGEIYTGVEGETVFTGENPFTQRQVTGLVVTGTEENPVLYISSSDPRIVNGQDSNLDTNSGVVTRVTKDENGEWQVVDIVRGLPRSEENHAVNGMQIDEATNKLYLQVGGNTNNGAPSQFFANTPEYTLSGTVLEIDLNAIDALPVQTDPNGGFTGSNGETVPRDFIYDLPTLDDPNRENAPATLSDADAIAAGFLEDSEGLDLVGPFGGNDGFNQAILPSDAPIRIFADGFRNAYDIVLTEDGNFYTVDNGSNGNLGDFPIFENGEPTNQINNGGPGDPEPLFHITEGGYYGHANPTRSNQDGAQTIFDNNGDPAGNRDVNTTDDLSSLVPDAIAGSTLADGELISASNFAAGEGINLADLTPAEQAARLAQSGQGIGRDSAGSNALITLNSSTNGIAEFQGSAFNGALNGALLTASFNGSITLLNRNADGTGLAPVLDENGDPVPGGGDGEIKIATGLGTVLDVTVGQVGSQFENFVFVAGFGPNNILVLAPTDQPIPGDTDADDDGLDNTVDPFARDSSNGATPLIGGNTLIWDFDPNQDGNLSGPDGYATGLTGVASNGVDDVEDFLIAQGNIDNVKFQTAAGGGATVIEEVANGTASGTANDGQFLFQTGFSVAQNVETFTVKWVVGNPGLDDGPGSMTTGAAQEIGGFLGTGDQSNFIKLVATSDATGPAFLIELENNDTIVSSQRIDAADLFTGVTATDALFDTITFELLVDVAADTATPTITYITGGTNTDPETSTVTGNAIDISGTNLAQSIAGDTEINGKAIGVAAGLFSTNGTAPESDAFQALFDEIVVESTSNGEAVVLHRVNIGGPAVTALDGGPDWVSDDASDPSAALDQDNNASYDKFDPFSVTAGASVPDYVPDTIFNVGRFDVTGTPGELTYRFDVGVAGTFQVNLFIGNGFDGASEVGERIYDVALEGNVDGDFSDIDPVFEFGHTVGGMLTNTVEVIDGTLDIEFLHQVENPNPFGIEILRLSTNEAAPAAINVLNPEILVREGTDATAFVSLLASRSLATDEEVTVNFTVTADTALAETDFDITIPGVTLVKETGTYTGQVTIAGGSSDVQIPIQIINDADVETLEQLNFEITSVSANAIVGGTSTAQISINDDDGQGPIVAAINAGGGALTQEVDGELIQFEASTGFANGSAFADGNNGNGPQPIFNNTVYATEIFGGAGAAVLNFDLAIPNGNYTVDLFFAEIFQPDGEGDGVGARVFDVSVEDALFLEDFDILGENGADPDVPLIRSTDTITVADGMLDIDFDASADNAKISAIVVREAVDGPADTTPPTVTVDVTAGTADTDAVVATLAFSEAITALDSADVTLTVPTVEGGTIDRGDGVVALAGDGLSATVTFAAPTQGFANGTYTVAVADAAVADAAGNTSAAVTGTVDVALSLGTDERYDENVNGDLSDDNTDPTDLPAFVEGSNIVTLFASDGNGDETGVPTDRDYFTIEVPTGFELSALTLVDYAAGGGSDNAAFIAISDEETINFTAEDIFSTQTEPANSNLIGGLLIGATEVGTDILADLGSGVVAGSGFDGPLGAGVYTVWLNQNADVSRASLDFELTPVAAPTNTVGDVVLAINSAGPSTDFEIDGELISFLSDQGPDKPANVTAAGNTFTDSNGGNGQQPVFDDTPFETERFGGNLSYTITDLEPGQYVIDLLFAELFQSEAGERVFDIQINESNVLGPFDILAETGGDINQSIISRVSAVVELGAGDDLVISGVNIVDNAKLNGFVIREATDERPVIQVADAPDALEAGDDGDTVLVFPITFSEPALGDVSVEVDVTIDGTTTTQTVNLGTTGGSIDVAVPNDAELTGPRDVTIAVTSVVAGDAFARIPIEGIVGGITASSTVADDEADVDGDTLLNADDPFAFDASNGLDSVLEAGGEITFDFNTDATDPFADAVGFTGVTTNPAFDPPGQSTADPLGVLTNEDKVTIADGVFSVTSSEQDSFGGGAGNSNTIRDNYQAGADVSGLTSFELVARASSADFASVSSTTGGFEQFGIQIGAGGVDDFIKFVIQDNGNSAQRIQLGHNGTLAVGGDRNTAITSVLDGDGTAINLADVATYEFRLLVNRDAEIVIGEDTFTISVTPTIVFLDDTGDEIASFAGPAEAVSDTSAFAAALDGNNPLTGGTGGIAYGIFISDFLASTNNEITADYDFVTLRALDDVPVSLVQDQTATFAEVGDTGSFTAPLALTAAAFSGTTDVTYSIDGGTTELTQSITFIDGAASLVVDVPADDLANGSEVITVDLISFSDDRLVADGSAATLDISIAEDDFAPVAEADVVSLEAGGTVTFNPAENDTDADDDAATLVVTEISNVSAAATEATVTLENGAVTVTALGAFTGSITFDYVVADQGGNTDTGTATVSVADTTAPVATLALDVPTAALGDIVVTITSDEAIGTFDLAGVTLTDGDGTTYAANTSDFTAGATAIAVTFAAPVGGFPQGTAYGASLAAAAIADAGGNGAEAVTLDTPVPFEIDDAPVFTNAPGAIVVAENIDGRIATYAATDADGDTVTYALDAAGETAGFSIDEITGELSIDTAFDFEVDPNSYSFGVTATSTGTDGAASIVKPVTVTISDVDEAPDAPRNETVTVEEDTDVVILANDGDDNGGADTVQGTADELDGVTIENFEEGDAVQVEANDANADVMIVDVRQGSVILGLDTDGDGQEDTTVTLEGSDFEDDDQETANDFQVEVQADGSTKIIYAPVQPNLPVRIQAEDFDDVGTSNFFEQTASAADEGALIRLGANQTGSVSLDLAAAGVQAGLNTLIIQVFDENDGASTLTASIDGVELGTVILDQDGGGNAAQAANKRLITFTDVDVPDGATLTLSGTSNNAEFLRIDFVEFTATTIVENGAPEIVPSFAPEGAITIAAGDALDLLTAFADPEEDPLAFTVTDGNGNPVQGVSIVDGTLAVAADADEGMVGIVLSATDPSGSGQTVLLPLTLTIDPPVAVPPVAGDPIDPQTATEDTLFSVEVPDELFTDANGDDIVVTAALAPAVVGEDPAPLPAWLTFTPATDTSPATLSGTPTQADIDALGDAPQLTILLTGTDDDGAATSTFTLDLTEVNDAPVVNPEAGPIGPIALAAGGTPIRIPLDDRFIDEEGNPFALSITGATDGGMVEILPAWVTLDTTDQGDGSTITELVIAPPADAVTDATTFAVEVVATETDTSDLLASEPVSINVTVSPPAGQALFLANVDAVDLLGASTFTGNSMQILNNSANGVEITKVTIDLAATFIPQTVFDTGSPSAGDAANKPFSQDSQTSGLVLGTDYTVSEAN